MKNAPPMQPEEPDLTAQSSRDSSDAGGEAAAAKIPEQTEVLPSLEELLREAELRAAEHHDAWLRAKADADNIRKRAQEDIAKAHRFGVERFGVDLLAVKDSLEAALAAENASVDNLRSGVELTLRQLESAFEKQSIREIYPVGEKFDPHRHQAISMLPSEKEPNTIINVLQKGYLLHGRVLRPALVTVAKPKDA